MVTKKNAYSRFKVHFHRPFRKRLQAQILLRNIGFKIRSAIALLDMSEGRDPEVLLFWVLVEPV